MIYKILNFFEYLPGRIKWFLQRVFRKTHTSDIDVWSLDVRLAEIILPKLLEFKKYEKHGYPMYFSDYDENSGWKNKEEYDKEKEADTIGGGEEKAWEAVLDEMIFAFEFILADSGYKKHEKKFKEKHGDWNAEIPENLQKHEWYRKRKEKNSGVTLFSHDEKPDLEEYELDKDFVLNGEFYYDMKMLERFHKRAEEGLKLFAKHFRGLWD